MSALQIEAHFDRVDGRVESSDTAPAVLQAYFRGAPVLRAIERQDFDAASLIRAACSAGLRLR